MAVYLLFPDMPPSFRLQGSAAVAERRSNELLGLLYLCTWAYYMRRETMAADDKLEAAHRESERLLLNVLPESVARQL